MVSDRYRLHRLRAGDEWALGTLAKGNARFGAGDERAWVPPLSAEDAAAFVNDPDTVCVVAIEMGTNQLAGFVYGGVLHRRHTKLRHLCIYEIGIDMDHRKDGEVGRVLLQGISAEARQMGIEQGFAFCASTDSATRGLFDSMGGRRSSDAEILYGFSF